MGGASAVAGSWADPGRILGGSCADPGRNLSRTGARHHLQTGRRVAEHPLRYHMVSCRGLPPAPTWIQASHFCNGPRLPCAQCAEHEALETAHTSQRIMEIYLQGLQRCMAQFWPQRLSCFYWVSVLSGVCGNSAFAPAPSLPLWGRGTASAVDEGIPALRRRGRMKQSRNLRIRAALRCEPLVERRKRQSRQGVIPPLGHNSRSLRRTAVL